MKKGRFNIFFLFAAVAAVVSCSKMDSYKQWIGDSEIVYTQKPDSLKVHTGYNRALISFLLVSDKRIVQAKVFWNNGADSMVVPITPTDNIDSVNVLLPNLPEDDYTFEVYTYDKYGNSSIAGEVAGKTYAGIYESSLLNRSIQTYFITPNAPPYTDCQIIWMDDRVDGDGIVGMKVTYTDADNVQQTVIADSSQLQTVLSRFPQGASFQYSTMYLPVVNNVLAIDTFYSVPSTVTVP